MVQFLSSIVITLLMVVGVYLYMPRRPIGTPLTWGEAMVGSLYVFVLFFLVYGVVPHYWLNWADSELAWPAPLWQRTGDRGEHGGVGDRCLGGARGARRTPADPRRCARPLS